MEVLKPICRAQPRRPSFIKIFHYYEMSKKSRHPYRLSKSLFFAPLHPIKVDAFAYPLQHHKYSPRCPTRITKRYITKLDYHPKTTPVGKRMINQHGFVVACV